ncbi:MAG: YdcF family protein [Patescibacteria group bacterium]
MPIEDLPKADTIFVFGHTDSRVAEHAAALYLAGKAPIIVITGGAGERTVLPEPYKTEAAYYQNIVVQSGVPDNAIILEDKSTNTLENVCLGIPRARAVCKKLHRVIAVAMPPLLRRALATMRKHFPDIEVVGSAFVSDNPNEWISGKWLQRLKGEIDRLIKYAKEGDIARVEIPNDILENYQLIT